MQEGRTIAVAAIVAAALPLCAAHPDERPASSGWHVDANGRAEAGRMRHLVPSGCGPRSAPVAYGGLGGRVEGGSAPPPETRLAIAGEADVRVGTLSDAGSRTVVLFRATPTLGVASEYFAAMLGAYFGNLQENEQMFGFLAGHLRFGTRDAFYMRLDLLDQPECFLADCMLGLSMAVAGWDEAVLELGGSLGVDGARGWMRAPFEAGAIWLFPGAYMGNSGGVSGPAFGVSLGVGTPW